MVSNLSRMRIAESTKERYRRRYQQHGISAASLGWSSVEHQKHRFGIARSMCVFDGRSVLDIGCGFGDFFRFLRDRGDQVLAYQGIDVCEEFILEAQKADMPASFEMVSSENDWVNYSADVVIMLGVINYKQDMQNPLSYAYDLIKKAFDCARIELVFDCISSRTNKDYPIEDWINYVSPSLAAEWASSLTPHFFINHSYRSIPQREMMLSLRRRGE